MNIRHFAEQEFAASLPDGIVVLNHHTEALWWNKAAQNLLSFDDESAKQTITKLLSPIFFKSLRSRQCDQHWLEFPAPNNSALQLAITLLPYDSDGYLLIIRDVTHTYHLEKMRQDFVANVSHELRTPLTVLRGYLEGILDNKAAEFKTWHAIFQQMNQQALRMEQVIEDLLLLSRLEIDLPSAAKQEALNIPTLLRNIRKDAIALSGDRLHNISLEITGPKVFYGSVFELHSAFSNLVFNAVHYTPANSNIYISWYKDKQGMHFAVRDTGIGIEAKHIPRLTERFYRVDPGRTRETGGTGLGLAIVKHVLIRHHGHLHIESEVGKGSLFRCDFPALQRRKKVLA